MSWTEIVIAAWSLVFILAFGRLLWDVCEGLRRGL